MPSVPGTYDRRPWLRHRHGRFPPLLNLRGKRWYSHTAWEMISTGYRCPLYDGGALSTDGPSSMINPKIIPRHQPT
ncbi:hypothetical protein QF027_008107 [Streptomyces canus]|nr:hypothetical protein [Streptomyces canus]